MELSWIQKHILMHLLRVRSARMKTLIPDGMPANQFTYHLSGLISDGLIEKQSRGVYRLTIKGQKLAGSFSTATDGIVKDVKTVIMLYAKVDDKYLLFRWSRQPYLGTVTLPYDRIGFEDSLDEAIKNATLDKLGRELLCQYRTTVLVKMVHDGVVVGSMSALVFNVDVRELSLPYVSRNGEAFLEKLSAIDGLSKLIRAIEVLDGPSEIRLLY